jgi:hypothetical protein
LGQQRAASAFARAYTAPATAVPAAAVGLQVPALRNDLPAHRRNQNLTGRMGRLHSSALLLFSALLDWFDDETGDAHLPDVPREFIKVKVKR